MASYEYHDANVLILNSYVLYDVFLSPTDKHIEHRHILTTTSYDHTSIALCSKN